MKQLFMFALLCTLVACKSLEEPIEMISYDGTEMEQFTGQLIKCKVGFHVENKLWVPVKMKPGSFELFIDQQKVGQLYIDAPIKIKAHREAELKVPLRIIPEPGFMTTAYKASKKAVVQVKISGYPSVGVWFLYKSLPVSKETQIAPAQFIPYFPTF
jgi:LEA14-like dessication related protein